MQGDSSQDKSRQNWVRAYIGLGSNEGDRVGYVQHAMQLLKDYPDLEVVECSSLYETEPVGNEYVEWFVNAVAAIETRLPPLELLDVCKEVEQRLTQMIGASHRDIEHLGAFGVTKTRVIDLDILFFGDRPVKTPELTVPHPLLTRRAYALVPLLEIAPDLTHPVLKKTVAQLHGDLLAPEQVFLYGTRDSCADLPP